MWSTATASAVRAVARGTARGTARAAARRGTAAAAPPMAHAWRAVPACAPARSARWFSDDSSAFKWFNFFDGEAVRTVEEIRSDEDLAPVWRVSPAQLHDLWDAHDPERKGVVTPAKAASLVRRVLETQRGLLNDVIREQRETKEDLLHDVSSWLPRWKQWGVTLEVQDQEDRIELAERLLEALRDPSLEAAILAALRPNAGGDITHFNFMTALTTGGLRAAELDALEEKAANEDAADELADASEPLIVAEATAAMHAAEAAHKAAELASRAAEMAAAAERDALELARAAKQQAEEISRKVHGGEREGDEGNGDARGAGAKTVVAEDAGGTVSKEREGSSEAGDEELDFMDLLASLDLIDYAGMLDEQQITTVEDLKLLTKEDLRDMGFSVGAGNRMYKWVRQHRSADDDGDNLA